MVVATASMLLFRFGGWRWCCLSGAGIHPRTVTHRIASVGVGVGVGVRAWWRPSLLVAGRGAGPDKQWGRVCCDASHRIASVLGVGVGVGVRAWWRPSLLVAGRGAGPDNGAGYAGTLAT